MNHLLDSGGFLHFDPPKISLSQEQNQWLEIQELLQQGKKKVPQQKPGKSEQTVCTPPDFIAAVKKRFGITEFAWDLAASKENSLAGDYYYDEEMDSLSQPWALLHHQEQANWNWCNPPYSKLAPWVHKAWLERHLGAQTLMLLPAAPGANWWREWVHGKAYVTYLNGRLTFVGHKTPYPKDLALLVYAPHVEGGECVWRWKE